MADTEDQTPDAATSAAATRAPDSDAADPVAALVATGDHPAAARLAVERGDLRRAITLYERIWRFADALSLALRLGDRPLAIRLALDASDGAAAARIAEEIPRDATAELRAAAASFAARGNQWEAARMAERAGDVGVAAAHFRRAGSLLDVGRMEELAGRPREAGLAYEQALAEASNPDDTAAAQLALGRLLARLGRHHDAARALQQAMRRPTCRLEAGRALTTQLVTLGLRVAAAEIVRRLRREWPDLPESPEELAALDAADAAASASSLSRMGAGAGGGPGASGAGLLRHRFKVLRALGAGATSHVYLAEDTLLGQPVALKLLSVGAGAAARGAERQAYLRFTREAEAAGRLRHPNIVALYDADPALGLFVLEMMSHGTLADRLADQKVMPPASVRRVALDLLSALGAAHDAGMVHRDVKPANILFDSVGNAKLADFGAAHLADFGQTQTGGLMGTVAYMSPEQISGGAIGPAADLYALAVTLFEALTGRLPFPGPDIVAQHLSEEPPAPSAVAAASEGAGAAVTGAHDAVLLRALRKAPSERWRSAAQMAEAIRSWPTHVVDATGDGAPSFGAPTKAPTRDAPAPTPDAPVGRSARGTLFRRDDPALGRPVLVELLDAPPTENDLARLKRLARAGGPHVQRMLGLSEDGRTVTYELCEGPLVPPWSLEPPQAQAIARAASELDTSDPLPPGEASQRPIIMTGGGPVLLIVNAVSHAESAASRAT